MKQVLAVVSTAINYLLCCGIAWMFTREWAWASNAVIVVLLADAYCDRATEKLSK